MAHSSPPGEKNVSAKQLTFPKNEDMYDSVSEGCESHPLVTCGSETSRHDGAARKVVQGKKQNQQTLLAQFFSKVKP